MAITWASTITPLNIASYEATISATRTDDIDPTNSKTYTVPKAKIQTAGERLAVADELWASHQADLAKETAVANFISTHEATLVINLEARE